MEESAGDISSVYHIGINCQERTEICGRRYRGRRCFAHSYTKTTWTVKCHLSMGSLLLSRTIFASFESCQRVTRAMLRNPKQAGSHVLTARLSYSLRSWLGGDGIAREVIVGSQRLRKMGALGPLDIGQILYKLMSIPERVDIGTLVLL